MSYRHLRNQIEKLEAEMTSVEPHRIEVCRAKDKSLIYAVGDGLPHQILAAESQVDYLRWLSSRLHLTTPRMDLLIGDRKSGTSWAGLVAAVSLAVANARNVGIFCDYCDGRGFDDVHDLLRAILPTHWSTKDSEETGRYRLPRHTDLRVVAFSRPQSWPDHRSIIMVDDYSPTSERQLEAILRQGMVQLVTGNPPIDDEPRTDWILRERDLARAAGTLHRFRSRQNQFLLRDAAGIEEMFEDITPEAESFWDDTGLEDSLRRARRTGRSSK